MSTEQLTLEPKDVVPRRCPVCGARADVDSYGAGDGQQRWYVVCLAPSDDCGVYGAVRKSKAEAIAMWNRLRVEKP